MTATKNNVSLHESFLNIDEETGVTSTHELNICLDIMQKPKERRKLVEVDTVIKTIMDLNIFDRNIVENLDQMSILTKLFPYFKYEFISAGAPIFHYESDADKVFIILKGKAREFEPKDLDTLEKESRAQYKSDPIQKNLILSLPDLNDTNSLNSLCSISNLQEIPLQSLQTLEVLCDEKLDIDPNEDKTAFARKKFRKMKAFLPFLKKMVEQKTATQRINDYNYKKALRKHRSFKNHSCNSLDPIVEDLANQVDENILEEFKRYPRAYFIGGVLKVKFSKYLYAGDHCGLKALTDNALRNRAVIVDEDFHCISLHKDDFLRVLEDERTLHADKIDFFKKIFDKFDKKKVVRFSLLWEHQSFQAGDSVCQQGENSDSLYALFQGEVVLSKNKPISNTKKKVIRQELPFRVKKKQDKDDHSIKVATLCSGDFIGDENFFNGENREFTATVSSVRAKLFKLSSKTYQENYKYFSEMFKEIKSIMALKVKWNKERLEELFNKPTSIPNNLKSPKTGPVNEVVKKQIQKFLPFSPEKSRPIIKELNFQKIESPLITPNKQTSYVFEHQYNIEGKIAVVIKERNRFGNSLQSSLVKLDQTDNLTMRNSSVLEKFNSTKTNIQTERILNEEKLETKDEKSQNLFARGKLPTFYLTKGENNTREENNLLTNLFDSKSKTRKKTADYCKSNGTARTSSIQVLRQKVIEQKSNDIIAPNVLATRRPSIDLDFKIENSSQIQNMSQEKFRVPNFQPSFTSLGTSNAFEKSSQKLKIVLSLKSSKKKQQQSTAASKSNLSQFETSIKDKVRSREPNIKEETNKLTQSASSFGFFSHGNLSTRSKSFSIKTKNHTKVKSLSNFQPLTLCTKFDPKDLIESELFKGFKVLGPRTSQEKIMVIPKVQAIKIL